MSGSGRIPSKGLRVLLCAALVGVLGCLGVVVRALVGGPGLLAFAVAAGLLVAVGVVRGRASFAPTPLSPAVGAAGPRTCTCCTTTQHDPVRIV